MPSAGHMWLCLSLPPQTSTIFIGKPTPTVPRHPEPALSKTSRQITPNAFKLHTVPSTSRPQNARVCSILD